MRQLDTPRFSVVRRCLNTCHEHRVGDIRKLSQSKIQLETTDPASAFDLAKSMSDIHHNAWVNVSKVVTQEEINQWMK